MNNFNEKEFMEISRKLNTEPNIEEITIEYANRSFFNKMKKTVEKDRRGEVVFCVIRPNGKYIVVTCSEYPDGIFRIPTGGIGHEEDIIQAVYRETEEELGLKVDIESFAGVIKFRFKHADETVFFYSYLFILREKGGKLLEDAIDDEISEIREVDIEELRQVAEALLDIQGRWSDWGKFRYGSTMAIYKYLALNGAKNKKRDLDVHLID